MIYPDTLRQIQQDIVDKLNSESFFANIAVVALDEMAIASEIQHLMPHLVGKNGFAGCGVIVGYPALQGLYPNVTPPEGLILISCDVIESPEQNLNSDIGTGITAQQAARYIRGLLHAWTDYGVATLIQSSTAIEPVPLHKELFPNCRCFRANFEGRYVEPQITKCQIPEVVEASALTLTLSVTDGSTIYYTTDGSFPGGGNAAALEYAAPFAVTGGTIVRAAGYQPGFLGSDVRQITVTS